MDKAKREEVLSTLVKFYRELKSGHSLEESSVMEDNTRKVLENPSDIFDINDSFHFDNSLCSKSCDAHCCMNAATVCVTPVDVDYFIRSNVFENKSRKEIADEYLEVFLGHESRIPMATIKFSTFLVSNIKICPFSFLILIKERKKDLKINGACILEEYKPTVCILHPLGRMVVSEIHDQKESIESWIYFYSERCESTKTTKEVKIRDHVKNLDEKTWIDREYMTTMNDLKETLVTQAKQHGDPNPKDFVDQIMTVWANVFFFNDGETLEKIAQVKDFVLMILQASELFSRGIKDD